MTLLLKWVRRALVILMGTAGLFVVAFIAHFHHLTGTFDPAPRNPYEGDNICFKQDFPGATGRYVQFTPVKCDAPHVLLGEPEGADMASLRFEDLDNDSLPEAIIESSYYKCTFGGKGCYDAYRIVMKVCPKCGKPVVVSERQFLADRHIGAQ